MARLTIVFVIWIASTVYAFDQADPDYDADLREAYAAWNEVDAPRAIVPIIQALTLAKNGRIAASDDPRSGRDRGGDRGRDRDRA